MSGILLKNGRVIDPRSGVDAVMDVLVHDGVIARVGVDLQANGAQVVDCTSLWVTPGLVDMHCHLRDPGYEYKETIATGTRAAAAGGFTSVCCMANTDPVADNVAVIGFVQEKARREAIVRVYPIGAVTKGLKGQELAEIGQMKQAGAIAFSDDGKPVMSGRLMRLALRYAMQFEGLIIAHEEELSLVDEGVMNEGVVSETLGLRGNPRSAEESMIARDLILAGELGARVHIAHVSTKLGVEMIRLAKSRGVAVTCETAPHYIAGTDALVRGYDGNARVNPPLREESDRQALIEGLRDGTVDSIATDHAPHHPDEKQVEFQLAASGFTGFETALGLCMTHLVKSGALTPAQFIERMSARPAEILGLPAGALREGMNADITVIDPDAQYLIDASKFHSLGHNTPFDGQEVTGRVKHTMVGGQWRYFDGELRGV